MKPKKSLGQNFLTNKNIIDRIINLIDCDKDDLIIEIGPGRGALTKKLSKLDSNYLSIEIDTDMKEYLDKLNVDVLYDDFLNVDLESILSKYKYKRLFVIGNLPYYITSPILEKLVNSEIKIDKMVFMVQKEVANRYSASCGSRDFGVMSIFLQYGYIVKKEFDVLKGNFNPVPKVDSAIISLVPNNIEYDIDFKDFIKFIKKAFSMKRKTLKNNLKEYNWEEINKVLKKHNLSESVRAENISREIFIEIYKKTKDDI